MDTVLFSFAGYDMSLLEFSGTVFNLWAVWLSTKERILTWPIGLIGVVLFGILFYRIQLYSDFVEQGYYFVTGIYGWWLWSRRKKPSTGQSETEVMSISHASGSWLGVSGVVVVIGSACMGYAMTHLHEWLPAFVTVPASFPYLDAFTTVLSFVGQIYVAYKKIECWYIWMIVNTIGVWLYFVKGVWLVSILLLVFLILSFKGYFTWRKLQKQAITSKV